MLKLMKYEFRKQILSKVIILVAIAVLEVIFLFGLFTDNEQAMATGIGLFAMLSVVAIMFVSFECIFTFSNDLKTKQSYMLFLTPNSSYKIVGAKVLTSLIYIALTAVVLIGVTALNIGIVMIKLEDVSKLIEFIKEALDRLFKLKLDYGIIFLTIASYLCSWIATVIIGMASITLSATFLSNTKVKGVVSVAFFFGFSWLISFINDRLPIHELAYQSKSIIECGYMMVVVFLFYYATAWMLDKKVSV